MKTNEINDAIEEYCKDFIDICPHCGAKSHLVLIHNDYHLTGSGDQYNYVTFRCKPCKKLSVRVYHSSQNPYADKQMLSMKGWVSKFPSRDITPDKKFTTHVPSEVLADYEEGLICISAGADKAAVGMFRRAMQNAMINLGAEQKLDLIEQIKSISSLTQDIKDWAHNVRIFGNWGAHPQDDLLKDVTPELAQEVRELIEEFMNYVYDMPGKVTAARRRYESKDATEKSNSKAENENV
ncbi:MAG: DUF4145 domain-containing protein [Candidatus Saccharimonadales bacterium]